MGSRGSKVGNTVVCLLLLAASLYLVVDAGEEGYAEASDDPAVWDDVELGENLAFDATPSGSAAMTDAPHCWNDGILTGQNGWISCTGAGGDGHWMQYEWTEPVSIWAFKIWHFYADGSRRLLAGCNDIQYWDGSKYVGIGGYNAENAGIMDGGKPYLQVCPEVCFYVVRDMKQEKRLEEMDPRVDGAYVLSVSRRDKCTTCNLCVEVCPVNAITIEAPEQEPFMKAQQEEKWA